MTNSTGNRIVHNTIFMYIRMVLTMIVSLFTVRVILKALGVEEYGVYMSIAGVVSSLSFISSVLASASQRFYSFELGKQDRNEFKTIFGTTFITYLIVSVVIIIIGEPTGMWFISNKMIIPKALISSAHWIFQFALASFIITLISNPFQALIISFEKMKLFAYISIIEVLMKLIVAFSILYCTIDKLKFYSILIFTATFITHIVYVIAGYKLIFRDGFRIQYSFAVFREIFKYTSWTMFGTIAGVFNTQGLNILLNMFYGPIANAAYAISNQVSTAVNSLASNFFVVVRPPLIKSYASGNENNVMNLLYFSTKIIFILLFILAFPIILNTRFILKLWLGQISDYMTIFVNLMLIFTIIQRLSDPITVIAQAANKVKLYHGIIDSFTMLTLPISYLILRIHYPADTVFFISISIFIIAHILRLIILKMFFNISITMYLKKIIVPIFFTILCCSIISFPLYLMEESTLISVIRICLSFIISTVICWLIVLNKNERNQLIKLIRRK